MVTLYILHGGSGTCMVTLYILHGGSGTCVVTLYIYCMVGVAHAW